jgi:hypothetical protein
MWEEGVNDNTAPQITHQDHTVYGSSPTPLVQGEVEAHSRGRIARPRRGKMATEQTSWKSWGFPEGFRDG